MIKFDGKEAFENIINDKKKVFYENNFKQYVDEEQLQNILHLNDSQFKKLLELNIPCLETGGKKLFLIKEMFDYIYKLRKSKEDENKKLSDLDFSFSRRSQ